MKKAVGLWIDRTKAVIFSLADEGAKLRRIPSLPTRNAGASGKAEKELISEHGEDPLQGRMDTYYNDILSCIRDAESMLIFGPGEAKLELRKRLEKLKLHNRIVGVETVDAMTDNQIVVKIRQRFLK